MKRFLAAALLLACFGAQTAWAASCPPQNAPVRTAALQEALARGRFVSYQPTALRVIDGVAAHADAASIHADLQALRPYFDGLITYTARDGAEAVPDIAAQLGYRAVIVGVWNPNDKTEMENALAAWRAHPKLVAGISLGNEIVFGKRGTWQDEARALAAAHRDAPQVAFATTEPFAQFLAPDAANTLRQMDFMLVNVHPIFEPWFATAPPFNWADFVVQVSKKLAGVYCGPILVKETGVPTGPASRGFNDDKQRAFYAELRRQMPPSRTRAFAYFSAFDAAWRAKDWSPVPGEHPEEALWGLFTEMREPKPAAKDIPLLQNEHGDRSRTHD
jgi:exo-beta-1,3-glucanase (GH17 family)